MLAAPATLERLYDFRTRPFDGVLDILRASVPCIDARHSASVDGLEPTLLTGADEVLLVAAPDLANLRNAKNVIDALRTLRARTTPSPSWC